MPDITVDAEGELIKSAMYFMPVTKMYLKTVFYTDKDFAVFALNGYTISSDWMKPYQITESNGKDIPFKNVDSKVKSCTAYGCQLHEYISMELNRDFIKQHVNTGLTFKIYTRRGNMLVNIPAAYITGFDNFLKSEGL